jgi:hypothetical protein
MYYLPVLTLLALVGAGGLFVGLRLYDRWALRADNRRIEALPPEDRAKALAERADDRARIEASRARTNARTEAKKLVDSYSRAKCPSCGAHNWTPTGMPQKRPHLDITYVRHQCNRCGLRASLTADRGKWTVL